MVGPGGPSVGGFQVKLGLASLGLCALLIGCAHEETRDDFGREIDNQDITIRELTARNNELVDRLRLLETELETLRAENASLRRGGSAMDRISELDANLRRLQEELGRRANVSGDDFTVRQTGEGVVFEIADTVLFASGKATLTDGGRDVLRRVAERVASLPNHIRVDGHSDTDPVVVHRNEYPLGNLELSGKRALNVAHFLANGAGLDASRVSFQGFGEYRPVADNDSRESKARNRRVEILIQNR